VGLGAPRILDHARGIPKTHGDASKVLLDSTQTRRCQLLFEPAFHSPPAVWFVLDDADEDATVYLRILANDRLQNPKSAGVGSA
jgi:hypothetical protein